MSVRGEIHLTFNNEARRVVLEAQRFTIGRGPENTLCLPVSVVSRSQAEIIRLGDDFLLRDLGSTNGTFVNNVRMAEQVLADGDVIRFGTNGPELDFRRIESESGEIITLDAQPRNTTANLMASLAERLTDAPGEASEEAGVRQLLAETHLNKGEHDRALELLAKYTDTANLIPLPAAFRASVLLWLGRIYVESKDLDLAIEALKRSLNFYQQADADSRDDAGQAAAFASLARALVNSGEFLAARDQLHRALLAARRAGNVRWQSEAHYLMGKVDWKEGDFEGASYNWSRAARLADGTGDVMLEGRIQLQLALALYTEGKLKECVPVYKSAIQQIKATGNVRLLLKAYSSLSRALARLGSWRAVEKLLEDRLRLAREHKLNKAEAVALTDLAELKLLQGYVAAAEASIQQAVQLHGQTAYARTQRILGRVLQADREPALAVEAFEKGLVAARERGAIEEQVLIGFDLALAYAEQGDLENARQQLETAESATSLDPALNLMARALFTRGQLHVFARELNEANRSFSQSLSIFQTINDPFRAALCHAAIGELRITQRRPESARAHLEEARAAFAKLGALAELRRVEAKLMTATLSEVQPAMTSVLPVMGGTAQLSMAHLNLTGGLQTKTLPGMQRVLVAVASDDLAELFQRGLEVENYFVDCVRDGREAFERATAAVSPYQLLLLDALLEHKSGFDVCRELRKIKRETPVILLGGRQGVEDKIEALQSGADDFLSKRNLVFEELLAKVEALLR
ncbi:MAG: FHA domain-containing protein [Blastocatellia bacterium]